MLGEEEREEVETQLSHSPLWSVQLPPSTSARSTSFVDQVRYFRVFVTRNGQQLNFLHHESRAMSLLVERKDEGGEDRNAPEFPEENGETLTGAVLPGTEPNPAARWFLASSMPRERFLNPCGRSGWPVNATMELQGGAGCGVLNNMREIFDATMFPNVDPAKIHNTDGFMVNVSYLGILQQRLTTKPASWTNVCFGTFVVDVPPGEDTNTHYGVTQGP